MNLTNVARSSEDEARKDFIKFLTRRKLPVWQEGEPLFEEARSLRPETLEEAAACESPSQRLSHPKTRSQFRPP